MRLLPCGDLAILVELDDPSQRRRLDAALRRHPLPGVVEHVPAARTVLVRAAASRDLAGVAAGLRALDLAGPATGALGDGDVGGGEGPAQEPLVLEVRYDGPDLADVARHLGVPPRELVARHTGQEWMVEFTGFAPGFGYLTAPGWDVDAPRHASPRTRVPAGAVGLAGGYTGVYPRPSPGGWQLVGTTDAVMWDAGREPPALLTPGRRVRFVAAPG